MERGKHCVLMTPNHLWLETRQWQQYRSGDNVRNGDNAIVVNRTRHIALEYNHILKVLVCGAHRKQRNKVNLKKIIAALREMALLCQRKLICFC